MAYLAFQDFGGAAAFRAVAGTSTRPVESGSLTPLEWTVIACARRDNRRSLRPEGWRDRLIRAIFKQPSPRLADPRLEALRRMAVLAWHDGYVVAGHEVRTFLAAGFTTRQYEAVVDHISAARVLPPRTVRSA